MEEIIKSLNENKDITILSSDLQRLFAMNKERYSFPELEKQCWKEKLWNALFSHLNNKEAIEVHQLCLMNVRVLSRDKIQIDDFSDDKLNTLLTIVNTTEKCVDKVFDTVKIESLMCLCNMIHNSETIRQNCVAQDILQKTIAKVKNYNQISKEKIQTNKINDDIKYYEMKILFIITALDAEARNIVRDTCGGFSALNDYLKSILNEVNPTKQNVDTLDDKTPLILSDANVMLACEILKTLFNLVLHGDKYVNETNDLIVICRCLLYCQLLSNDKKNQLHNNIVNILTCLEPVYYPNLAIPATKQTDKKYIYDKLNVKSLHILLEFLQYKLAVVQNIYTQDENLSPILTVMIKAAMSCSSFRKYFRIKVLPPLKDVHTRPEIGNTLRNQLCRLLTTTVTHVRDLNAHFLFILCKENVGRMVKYTGYGNAAGLFATRGLLGPNKFNCSNNEYSSDSEDSDTDEYMAMKHTVNPITGCYEPPHTDPMEGCTEEQKEYEAMKLVNLMDQLNRAGVIQPCRIGSDGRPEPVEHVLQLQEDLQNQQVQNR